MAPAHEDFDPNEASVEQGLNLAENERREAVADAYEEAALQSENAEENLADIDLTEAEEDSVTPELSAIHREQVPTNEI